MADAVTVDDVVQGMVAAGLSGRAVCVHSSLRSFGPLQSGAATVIDGILAAGSTLMVPTSTFRSCLAAPPPGTSRSFNSEDDGSVPPQGHVPAAVWRPEATYVDPAMGSLPAEVLLRPERVRGDHPLSSFAAVGPEAAALVAGQRPLDVFRPLRELAARGGAVVAMGVGLNAVTHLHLAEQEVGIRLLRRWALTRAGVVECEHGGCSRGFENLAAAVAPAESRVQVGRSAWRVWSADRLLSLARAEFQRNPGAGRCADRACARCRDAMASAEAGLSCSPTTSDRTADRA